MRTASLLLLCALRAFAEPTTEVPPRLATLVMLKVLTYDAGFEGRGQGDFVVAIPFSKGAERAAEAVRVSLADLDIKTIKQRSLVFRTAAWGSKLTADAVLVSSALSADDVRGVVQASRAAKQYSLTFDERQVGEGVLLGVASVNGKPQPVLNVSTARVLGAEFSPSVLKLVRAVQGP
ncbi:MAG: DUF4154 domain-containing protein [Archangium sp.]|nr:DUF4154 domain-containing protein [Archangium sp.]